MDNSNNSQNFSASPTTNDINAANHAAQNPPLAPADTTPTPTWLPPTPGQVGQQPDPAPVAVNPFSTAPTPQAAAPDSTAWPSTPQDHGSTSPNAGWNPPAAAAPEAQPLSPMNSSTGNTFGSSTLTSEPATSNPSWTPPPTDQSMPTPATAVSTSPAWTPPAVIPEVNAYSTPPPQAATPAWTPPVPEPSPIPPASAPSASSVFPPQFQQPSPPTSNASYDPLAAATNSPTPPTTPWPTPPTDQSAGSFATPQPPLAQASAPVSSPAFVPSMENPAAPTSQSTGFSTPPAAPSAPTVPDFISNLNNQSPAGGAPGGADQVTSGFGSSADTNPTDLSGVGSPINNSVYSPTIGSQEPTPVSPSGIPETVANVNKPRLSKMLIIIGLAAILLVAASASYLLFFGPKPGTPEDTISLPVSNQAPLTKPKEIATPAPDATVATSSASTPDASPSGSSAFDLLKKAKTATPSPSPK